MLPPFWQLVLPIEPPLEPGLEPPVGAVERPQLIDPPPSSAMAAVSCTVEPVESVAFSGVTV